MTAPASRKIKLAFGITIAGVLAGGGFAAATAATGAATAAGNGSGTGATAQSTASAQELTALQQMAGQQAGTANGGAAAGRNPLNRLRRLGSMYGSFAFRTKAGVRTLAFERGTITSVSGSDVIVRAADGTTMTWLMVGDTVIRHNGATQAASALSGGETVFVGGTVVGGAHDARLIVIRPAARKAAISAAVS